MRIYRVQHYIPSYLEFDYAWECQSAVLGNSYSTARQNSTIEQPWRGECIKVHDSNIQRCYPSQVYYMLY